MGGFGASMAPKSNRVYGPMVYNTNLNEEGQGDWHKQDV